MSDRYEIIPVKPKNRLFCEATVEIIVNCLAEGNSRQEAWGIAKISEGLFYNWLNRGDKDLAEWEEEYDRWCEYEVGSEPILSEKGRFAQLVAFAESTYWIDYRKRAKEAARISPAFWQWEATMNERLQRKRFGKDEVKTTVIETKSQFNRLLVVDKNAWDNHDIEGATEEIIVENSVTRSLNA